MSLLLDALKKSEQERKANGQIQDDSSAGKDQINGQGTGQESHPIFKAKPNAFGQSGRLPSLLKLTGLLVGGAFLGLASWWVYIEKIDVVEVNEPLAPAVSTDAMEQMLENKMQQSLENKLEDVFSSTPDMLSMMEQQGVPAELTDENFESEESVKEIYQPDPVEVEDEPKVEGPAPSIFQMAPDIQRQVPNLTFQGYLYSSDPAYRSATINGRKLREGDWLNPDIQLLKIGEQNLTYSVRGIRFSIPVMTDYETLP